MMVYSVLCGGELDMAACMLRKLSRAIEIAKCKGVVFTFNFEG
jgi:hypothetical protein